MLKILYTYIQIGFIIKAIFCEYTQRSTNGFVCKQDQYFNPTTKRCEINFEGLNHSGTSHKCIPNDYAEYTVGGITRCRYIKKYLAVSSCNYFVADNISHNLICQECNSGFALISGLCRTQPETIGCKTLTFQSNLPLIPQCSSCEANFLSYDSNTKCKACLSYGVQNCTNINASCTECLACQQGYAIHPDKIGCVLCPNNGCNCSITKDSSGNLSYSCDSCQDGFYMDTKDGANKCYSCERTFGIRCNKCTKQKCTECKDEYYLSSEDKCVSCPMNTNCTFDTTTSTLTIIGCVAPYASLKTSSTGQKYCDMTDQNAIELNSDFTPKTCKNGFKVVNGNCINASFQEGCNENCTTCNFDGTNHTCTSCNERVSLMLGGDCKLCKDFPQYENDVYPFSTSECFTSFNNPNKDPNCFHEFGFSQGGVCNVCLPGFKLIGNLCKPCITYTITTSEHIIVYSCTSNSAQDFTLKIPINTTTVTIPADPLTQPEFYSSFLGIPSTLLSKLQINILNPINNDGSPTDSNDKTNENNQNNKDNTSNNNNTNNNNNSNTQTGKPLSDQSQSASFTKQINFQIIIFTLIAFLTLN